MSSIWMVQNDDGKYLDYTDGQGYEFMSKTYGQAFAKLEAEAMANVKSGHLVELVPAKPEVPVSREEAVLIDGVINGTDTYPASGIHDFVVDHFDDGSVWPSEEFRLMEAAINGYTVVEPTKYNVKVPHTDDSYFYKINDEYCNAGDSYHLEGMTDKKWFTAAEIKHYGLEDCERVEVNTEDSDERD